MGEPQKTPEPTAEPQVPAPQLQPTPPGSPSVTTLIMPVPPQPPADTTHFQGSTEIGSDRFTELSKDSDS
jgi:hypothetical protein